MIVALIIVLSIILLIFYVRRKIIMMKKAIKKPADSAMLMGSDILLKGKKSLKVFFLKPLSILNLPGIKLTKER